MNKSELIESIILNAKKEGKSLTKEEATSFINSFQSVVTEQLSVGEPVSLIGFGTFSIGYSSERTGRNPKTGEEILIRSRVLAKFKPGKSLKDAVNRVI